MKNDNHVLIEDITNSVDYRYMYDLSDRIARIEDSNGNTTAFGYDDNSNATSLNENISGTNYITGYVYNADDQLKEADIHGGGKVTYSYDTMGRLSTATITSGTYNQQTTYNYNNEKLQSIVLPGGRTISYTYDNNGNILTINDTGNNKEIEYKYNELDELIRENNQVTGKTVIYAYDDGGNIQSKTEYAYTTDADPQDPTATHTYSYDATWKDKLASYDGQAITYDNAGNPTGYNGLSFAWQNGNQLKSITGNGLDISYKYDYAGTRTEKTVNGTTTKYHLVNGNVTYEITHETDDTYTIIYYTYDNSGNILSMNLNGTEYYYLKNAQGDIIGLTDSTGTQVVSYTYDSWGKLISIDGTLKDTVGVKNPYRYRGYRYVTETGLYYLQSRYYNPEWGRFLNADDVSITKTNFGQLLGTNLFTYCNNNPVNMVDPNGHELIGALIGAGFGGLLGLLVANYYHLSGWKKWACISGFAVGGAAIGWFAGPIVARLAKQILASLSGLTAKAIQAVSEISNQANKVHHIIYGSEGHDHLWDRLVSDLDWGHVSNIIYKVLLYGKQELYKGNKDVFIKTLKINGHIVQVTYRLVEGLIKISDGWVVK